MYDPDFDWLTLVDTSQNSYFDEATGAREWALEDDGGAAAPGATPVTVEQFGADISCQYVAQAVPLVYATATWRMPLFGGVDVAAPLRAAIDTVMAAQPATQYLTFQPQTQIQAHNALNACGDRDTAVYDGATPDPDVPPPLWTQVEGHLGNGTDEPQRYEIDGSPVDIAASYDFTNFYVGDSWGPVTADGGDDGGLDPDSRWGQLGLTRGMGVFLLRPTALTWAGQDPANTANRAFWAPGDVAGDVTHFITGQWGHYQGSGYIDVQGWVLVESRRWMCLL